MLGLVHTYSLLEIQMFKDNSEQAVNPEQVQALSLGEQKARRLLENVSKFFVK